MPTYPVELYPADATLDALDGVTDQETGIEFVAKGVTKQSSPPLSRRFFRMLDRLTKVVEWANQGRVVKDGSLTVGVFPIDYRLGGTNKTYAGSASQAVTDNATNYVYLDASNALVINTTGFPGDLTTFFPLATVVTVSGAMTFTDERDRVAWTVPQLLGSYALDTLANLGATAINASLLPETTNSVDMGSAAKAWRTAYLRTSLLLLQATNKFTLSWPDPAEDRVLSLIDPGADAQIALSKGAQVFEGKTLLAPTIAADQWTNANHTHADADHGGLLTNAALGTGKYFPFCPSFFQSGTLSVAVLAWEFVAPRDFTLRSATGRVKTAPTGQSLIVDVRVNGASIYANQTEMIVIPDAGNSDVSAVKDAAVGAGDVVTIEVEQVGSGTAGADLTVVINGLAAADSV